MITAVSAFAAGDLYAPRRWRTERSFDVLADELRGFGIRTDPSARGRATALCPAGQRQDLRGVVCTLTKDHTGEHVACDDEKVWARWPRATVNESTTHMLPEGTSTDIREHREVEATLSDRTTWHLIDDGQPHPPFIVEERPAAVYHQGTKA